MMKYTTSQLVNYYNMPNLVTNILAFIIILGILNIIFLTALLVIGKYEMITILIPSILSSCVIIAPAISYCYALYFFKTYKPQQISETKWLKYDYLFGPNKFNTIKPEFKIEEITKDNGGVYYIIKYCVNDKWYTFKENKLNKNVEKIFGTLEMAKAQVECILDIFNDNTPEKQVTKVWNLEY